MSWLQSRNDRRKQRNQQRMQAQFGAFTADERIITLMTIQPFSHAGELDRELASAASTAPPAHRGPHLAAHGAAARFPQTITTLILSEFSLVATDIHPHTGQASTVLARYDLGEVAGLHAPGPGTSALLSFSDGGAVTLRGIPGVAKHTRQFYNEAADYLRTRGSF